MQTLTLYFDISSSLDRCIARSKDAFLKARSLLEPLSCKT